MITNSKNGFNKWLLILWAMGCICIVALIFSSYFFNTGRVGNEEMANVVGLNSTTNDPYTKNDELVIGDKGSFLIGNNHLQEKSIKLFLSVPVARKRSYDSSKQNQRLPINSPSRTMDNSGFSIRPVPK